jgi:hypothetical protein
MTSHLMKTGKRAEAAFEQYMSQTGWACVKLEMDTNQNERWISNANHSYNPRSTMYNSMYRNKPDYQISFCLGAGIWASVFIEVKGALDSDSKNRTISKDSLDGCTWWVKECGPTYIWTSENKVIKPDEVLANCKFIAHPKPNRGSGKPYYIIPSKYTYDPPWFDDPTVLLNKVKDDETDVGRDLVQSRGDRFWS